MLTFHIYLYTLVYWLPIYRLVYWRVQYATSLDTPLRRDDLHALMRQLAADAHRQPAETAAAV